MQSHAEIPSPRPASPFKTSRMPHADAIEAFPEPEFLEGAPPTPADRMLAVVAHAGGFFLSFVMPAILLMTHQDKSPFVARHAREALNYQITLCLHAFIVYVTAIGIGVAVYYSNPKPFWADGVVAGCAIALLLTLLVVILEVVLIIRACRSAFKGRDYRYPFTIRLI